jgi:hypothetical protein
VTNKREELNELLVEFLGTRNVYFQPAPNVQMQYPAITYEIDDQDAIYANNNPYRRQDAYQLTLIDYDPEVPVHVKVETLRARFVRAFPVDGLNHRIYSLYF